MQALEELLTGLVLSEASSSPIGVPDSTPVASAAAPTLAAADTSPRERTRPHSGDQRSHVSIL